MDEGIKKVWVEALRSGRYNQGESVLYDKEKDAFCCLGVLRDLYPDKLLGEEFGTYLRPDCIYQIGLSDGQQVELGQLNDMNNYTFEKIADYIEEHL